MKGRSIVLALVVGACSGTTPSAAPTAGTPRPLQYATLPPGAASPGTTAAPTRAPEAPAPTKASRFTTIHLSGKGDKVAKFTIPENEAAIATITYKGSSNFAVWTLDGTGDETDLLVNTIGSYSGTVLFDIDAGAHTVAFKIEASGGSWTADVKPILEARTWDSTSELKGKTDDVVYVTGVVAGLRTAQIKYSGDGNFAVWSYTADDRDLLVNEIDSYSGEVLLPSGLLLLVIEAAGSWSVTPSS